MRGVWSEPVEIELGSIGSYRVISDTEQAAEALLFRWPVDKGKAFTSAKRVCLAVLEGENETFEDARNAFLAAAEEADVSVRQWQRSIPQGKSVGNRFGKRHRA
ncbi:DUF982 domain-containing protein [Neorhizobium galegae]|uniref:DUF982 domain-containing protein n=1 Tax=Neorhizobium galegae TaxID=399 RepID=A0A6A1TV10_NEOGA|nr:DUF982 domain-containing protein [Neorhizobium galegae]KAB1087875.1 DUF982 domain-containing protein [Neorhizobium galegae]